MAEIKFEYRKTGNYSLEYVNGCYGGKSPKGEIVLNFFKEGYSVPESETYDIDGNGKLGNRLSTEPTDLSIVRDIDCGVIMSEQTAREIYEWLGHVLDG